MLATRVGNRAAAATRSVTLGSLAKRGFQPQLQSRHEDVRLSHMVVNMNVEKPMIVLHGLLGSKVNWRTLCTIEGISKYRKCLLVEQRNHATSDHHGEHSYEALSDDIIRFADEHRLDKFTIMGHSMGGRTAMTTACRYPDRVDGMISVDSAPKNEQDLHAFGSFAERVIDFMCDIDAQTEPRPTMQETLDAAKSFFDGQAQLVTLVHRSLVSGPGYGPSDPVKFAINLKALKTQFANIPYFDETLRFHGPALNIVGGRSRMYEFSVYQKVFPNYKESQQDVVTIPDAGHWVHFDKPKETISVIEHFLRRVDGLPSL